MALPDSLKLIDGTEFIVADATDWSGGAVAWGATPDANITTDDTFATNTYRQSTKLNLTANRDALYSVHISAETETDAAVGDALDLYVGFSHSATAGTGNPGGLVGTASAYTGFATGSASEGVKTLEFVGSLALDVLNKADDAIVGFVGTFEARKQYALFVVHNNSGVSLNDTDAVEFAIQVVGIHHQIQD